MLLLCTFGGNDYGFDSFHFDASASNLYVLQFKWTENAAFLRNSKLRKKLVGDFRRNLLDKREPHLRS